MAIRRFVSRATINDWMTEELQRALGDEACQLTLKYPLREPDADGCNWSEANLRCGSGINLNDPDSQRVKQIADEIVKQARQLFNLTSSL